MILRILCAVAAAATFAVPAYVIGSANPPVWLQHISVAILGIAAGAVAFFCLITEFE